MESAEQSYDKFAAELSEWSESGVNPPSADQDSGYYLSLQKERLEKKNLQMKLSLEKYKEDESPQIIHYPGLTMRISGKWLRSVKPWSIAGMENACTGREMTRFSIR